ALGASIHPDEITLGAASESLVPPIMQELANASLETHWPVGLTLPETRPVRLLSAVIQHLGTARNGMPADFHSLSELIRHPDLFRVVSSRLVDAQVIEQGTDWLSELDRYRIQHLQNHPGAFLGRSRRTRIVEALCRQTDEILAMLCVEPKESAAATAATSGRTAAEKNRTSQRQLTLYDQGDIEDTTLSGQLSRRRPLTEWCDGVVRLLQLIYGELQLDSASLADRGIVAAVTAVQQICQSLHAVPSTVVPRCNCAQALQLLLRLLPETAVPPEGSETAIDMVGWLDLPLDDAPYVILAGFNEGAVPESITSDVFLPNSLRASLGLNDNRRRYARDAYAMTTLMHSHSKVVVISGRSDAQGNPLAPSRLWLAADPDSLPLRIHRFYQPENTEDSSPGTALSGRIRFARQSGFIVPEPTANIPAPVQISVTAFRDYLYCPYRYFLKQELQLRTIEDDVRELSAASFGSLIHEVLNRFGDSAVRHATSAEAIDHFLLNELRALALRRFGRTRSATVGVQLQMAEARLTAFASHQAQRASEGWRIHRTEDQLIYPEFKDIHGRPVALKGRVDRIDRHERTGEWCVLDYKTGDQTGTTPEKTHQRHDEWIDLQLPLYRLLVRSAEIDGEISLGYVTLPGDPAGVRFMIAGWTAADLAAAEVLAQQLAADILDLKIDRVAPGNDLRYGELAGICQDTVIDRQIPWLDT
ncbi:MAG: PD-(D/E)XK nuclease family protein, partial [Planctomycetaceae bacterium]|nr:PD-(D/E)XK nuclease family protein [Planctomycetaceae bacterium]